MAARNNEVLMPFEKGISGNPNGRPKSAKPLTDALRYLGKQPVTSDGKIALPRNPTVAQHLAKLIYERGFKGDLKSIRFIWDRVDGKA